MKKNSGFGVIGIVLVAAAVALVGLIGWRLYEANKSKQSNSSSQTSNTQQSNAQTQGNASTSSQADTATYLDIKELGVKIKLSDDIKDATYYYDAAYNAQYPNPKQVTISTQSLADKSNGSCKASSGIGPLGAVQKYGSDVDGLGNPLTANGSTVFKLGSDFVLLRTPQAACTNDSSVEALAKSQRASFLEAFKSVQLDK